MSIPADFVFKPFAEMTPADYAAVGFKAGLEIHQQLLTRRKLFCRCPAGRYSTGVDTEYLRHMRPTLSEMGEYDGTALMEFKTKKEIVYQLNQETVCTYEMDDAPPFEPDPEAVAIALEVALLLKINLVQELHIARKQYLDGSIPTGFQRTTILGIDGEARWDGRSVRIIQLGLEEDACREVADAGHRRTYRTDRLGMPLIETVTYPDLHTPEEAAEAARVLSEIARATGKVRVGAGAAREDVNVSITGGTRIEIKGVSSIKRIPRLVYNEALRQYNLLKIREELARRGITPETFQYESSDVTGILRFASFVPVAQALERDGRAAAVRLHGFGGLLAHPTQEHTYFSQEVADRVRVIACLTGFPNLIHSDATEPGVSRGQWNKIRKRLRASPSDAILIVWGPEADVKTAVSEIAIRAREAAGGVPSETRQAFKDGTNGFERILPGPQRMYPDTDEPPLALSDGLIGRVSAHLPELPYARRARLRALGLAALQVEALVSGPAAACFDRMIAAAGGEARRLAAFLTQALPGWKRRRKPVENLTDAALAAVFKAAAENRLLPEAVPYCLKMIVEQGVAAEAAIEAFSPRGSEELDLFVLLSEAQVLQHNLISRARSGRRRYLMGRLMARLRGRLPARAVEARLEEVLVGDDD